MMTGQDCIDWAVSWSTPCCTDSPRAEHETFVRCNNQRHVWDRQASSWQLAGVIRWHFNILSCQWWAANAWKTFQWRQWLLSVLSFLCFVFLLKFVSLLSFLPARSYCLLQCCPTGGPHVAREGILCGPPSSHTNCSFGPVISQMKSTCKIQQCLMVFCISKFQKNGRICGFHWTFRSKKCSSFKGASPPWPPTRGYVIVHEVHKKKKKKKNVT